MDTAEVLTRERQTTIDAAEAALLRAHSPPLRICRPKRSPPATRDAVRLLARSSRPSQLGPDRRLRPTSGARTLQCGLRPFGGPDGVQCPGGGDMELHLHCIAAAAVCRSPGAGQHDSRSRQRRARAGIRIACDEQTCAFARPTSPICWPGGSCATRMTTAAIGFLRPTITVHSGMSPQSRGASVGSPERLSQPYRVRTAAGSERGSGCSRSRCRAGPPACVLDRACRERSGRNLRA